MKALPIVLAAILFHIQLASAAGCDLPSFGGARLFAAANDSTYMATGDFNQDGFIDVVLGGSYTDAAGKPAKGISVVLGNGDGTFQPPVYYPIMNGPDNVVVADFNGDGKLDLAVIANFSILVMPGNGDGTFRTGIGAFVPTTTMAVGDFNGDGKPDLAVVGSPVGILLGKGDGTFQAPISPAGTSAIGYGGVAVGDFNGDGKLDVVTGNLNGGIFVLLGDGKGNLGAPANFGRGTASAPGILAVGDLNGDRKLDVVILNPADNSISVLLGNGNGAFQAATTYALGSVLAASLLVADLNGDGKSDLAVTILSSYTASGTTISVFPGNGDGTFGPAVKYNPTAQVNWALAVGDFNSDGLPDLVFTSSSNLPAQVGVMFGAADGTFQSPLSYAVGPAPGLPVLADLNGDGVLDLVVANTGPGGNLSVLLGAGDGSFQPAVSYPAAAGARYAAVGDFNGDGKPDLVVSTFSGTAFNILVFRGNGDGTFQSPLVTGSVFNTGYVVVGDFNKDGKLDVAISGQILLGNGDGSFRVTLTFAAAALVAADLNGDGNLDLVGPGTGGAVLVQLGNGDGTFKSPVNYATGRSAAWVAVGDLNGDGKPDLVAVSDVLAGTIAVLLGNGDGTFQPAVKYAVAKGLTFVTMGDFNGDGATDLAAVSVSNIPASVSNNPGIAVTVLLGNGSGTFRNALTYGAGPGPASLAVGDLNGDGKPDLVTADDFANNVLVLLNTYIPGSGGSVCSPVPALGN